jgi:hypothetical protein
VGGGLRGTPKPRRHACRSNTGGRPPGRPPPQTLLLPCSWECRAACGRSPAYGTARVCVSTVGERPFITRRPMDRQYRVVSGGRARTADGVAVCGINWSPLAPRPKACATPRLLTALQFGASRDNTLRAQAGGRGGGAERQPQTDPGLPWPKRRASHKARGGGGQLGSGPWRVLRHNGDMNEHRLRAIIGAVLSRATALEGREGEVKTRELRVTEMRCVWGVGGGGVK